VCDDFLVGALDGSNFTAILTRNMARYAVPTKPRTPRRSAARVMTSSAARDNARILFGFVGIGILVMGLVLVILGAGRAGLFG
jgi:hypothetical protein